MKKVITGASILLTGALIFLSVFIAAGSYSAKVSGWGRHGRFWSSVSELGLVAVLIISIVVMGVGIAFLKWGNSENRKNRHGGWKSDERKEHNPSACAKEDETEN